MWQRGEDYAADIIEVRKPLSCFQKLFTITLSTWQDLNNWVRAWIDWNMALNTEGGPTYVSNFVDSPIIVNATGQEFYKQPMYYALGHFSKFLTLDALRVNSHGFHEDVPLVAFTRLDGGRVVVILNK